MATWAAFTEDSPQLSQAVYDLLFQYGTGMAYLGTVRRDGGPRIHPVSPMVVDGQLYCLLLDTPKRRDLERDGRYALHSYPAEDADDEAYLSGWATPVPDHAQVNRVTRAVNADTNGRWRLFVLSIDVVALTRRELGYWRTAQREVWHDPARSSQVA
jgi:hypothetical protein